jgi:N-methylhydantoinase B
MSTSSTGQAIRVCVNACVARMLEASEDLAPTLMASCQSAGAGACTISGTDDMGNGFATMTTDDITGGGGARHDADGADSSGFTTSPGASVANVEVNESYLPIRYLRRRELVDSGGPGAYRGGVGTFQLLAPHKVSAPIGVLSFGQGLQHPAAIGIAGGEPGGQSGFAILADRIAHQLAEDADDRAGRDVDAEIATAVPLPTAGMLLTTGQTMLVVSQGGGGYGDPIDRAPGSVADDIAEGLVSRRAGKETYGVVTEEVGGYPRPDVEATDARRQAIRSERLGGRSPRPAVEVGHRRFSEALSIDEGNDGSGSAVVCRRCGVRVCSVTDNLYEHLIVQEAPTTGRAPLGLHYEGSAEFVVRSCFCPGCGRQVDVQVGRAEDAILQAIEPL